MGAIHSRAALSLWLGKGPALDGVGGTLHHAEMHPGEVLADDADGKELDTGEDGNDRGQKGEPLHDGALEEVADDDQGQDRYAKERA